MFLKGNGIVAGLVGITGPCGVVEPYAAAIIGIVSGAVYCGSWRLHERLRIDDPVHAGAVHAWPGFWGCIASGLFAWPEQVSTLGYVGGGGLFYTGHGGQFGTNVLGTLVVLAWTVATSSIVFGSLQAAKLLRVTAEEEEIGAQRPDGTPPTPTYTLHPHPAPAHSTPRLHTPRPPMPPAHAALRASRRRRSRRAPASRRRHASQVQDDGRRDEAPRQRQRSLVASLRRERDYRNLRLTRACDSRCTVAVAKTAW